MGNVVFFPQLQQQRRDELSCLSAQLLELQARLVKEKAIMAEVLETKGDGSKTKENTPINSPPRKLQVRNSPFDFLKK